MKVVHVEDRFEPEAGYQINELIKEQVSLNYDITVITSNIPIFSDIQDLKEKDKAFEKKYSVHIIRLNPLFVFSQRFYFKRLFRRIDSLKPDIVFLHGIVDFKDLILFFPQRKYVIVRDCHMSWVASKNKLSGILPYFYSFVFSRIINNTSKYKKIYSLGLEETQYLKKLKIKDSKIENLYHGYNSKEVFYSREYRKKIRENYGVNESDIFIGYIGKFDKNKQPDLIFDILNNIDEKYKKRIKILFVGNLNGDYKLKFLEKSTNSELQKCIFYERAQPYENLYKYYSALDICIWPKETTLSSIHAQVCHTIPIMENHLSNRERVVENKFLYNVNDLEDASNVLQRVIDEFNQFDFNLISQKLKCRDYTRKVKYLDREWRNMLNE